MKTRRIYILGGGGHAREVKQYIEEMYGAFVFGDMAPLASEGSTIPRVIRFVVPCPMGKFDISLDQYYEELRKYPTTSCSIMGSGHAQVRRKMNDEIRAPLLTIKHDRSFIASSAVIGEGSLIAPQAQVANMASIGEHVLVNHGASIGHDTHIGKWVTIAPNAAIGGCCEIRNTVYIGSGAMIKEGITVGKGAIVGMGAVVIREVAACTTVVGNPACPMSRSSRDV